MKKYLRFPILMLTILVLSSWGGVGHKTVATIAYNHLNPQAKEVVKRFLGDTTMADVASWADEVLRQPAYRNTAPEHYLNVPLGLSYDQFEKEVLSQSQDNVYKAVERNKSVFISDNSTKQQRLEALKFLIHFVGDLHQPMHVSRAEDKGGNTIQLQYEGKGTNLHSLWDGKLIGTEGKTFEQMSIDYDKATKKQIKQWQADPLMKWLWESYQISSTLYPEIEQSNKLDENYFKSHIDIVHQRVEQAGIRLAGLLNNLCKNLAFKPDVYIKGAVKGNLVKQTEVQNGNWGRPPVVTLQYAASHIGETVTVMGFVNGKKEVPGMMLLDLGFDDTNKILTVVAKGKALKRYKAASECKFIQVIGKVTSYNGRSEIIVTNQEDLRCGVTL